MTTPPHKSCNLQPCRFQLRLPCRPTRYEVQQGLAACPLHLRLAHTCVLWRAAAYCLHPLSAMGGATLATPERQDWTGCKKRREALAIKKRHVRSRIHPSRIHPPLDILPHDAEHGRLQRIGQNAGAQTPREQTDHAVSLNNLCGCLAIADRDG